MKGLALDSGEFIPADELNARWLPRKATEEEMSEKQPKAMQLADEMESDREHLETSRSSIATELRRLHAENEALRAQIGQGEPVAHLWQHEETGRTRITMPDSITDCDARWHLVGPLYTHPAPQQKPLTDERAESSVDYWQQRGYLGNSDEWREVCRLFRVRCSTEDIERMAKLRTYIEDGLLLVLTPPAPKQKPLTDEQINQMWSDAHNDTSTMSLIHVLVRAVEAAHNIGEKK